MKILVIGSTGMLGHVVSIYLKEQGHDIYKTNRKKEGDLYYDPNEDIKKIEEIIKEVKPDTIINCIGLLNKYAEEHKREAVLINSYLPHYLDDLSRIYNFKFIHISTDCVFEGTIGKYTENSLRDATSFYGRSKALGEIENTNSITLRTSIIGPDPNPNGIGLFKWFMNSEGTINGYTKAIWSGVTTIELAKQINIALENNLRGLYHVVNGESISKYDLLNLIKDVFNKEIEILKEENFTSDKSIIATRNDFIFNIPTYKTMIKEMKEWIDNRASLYEEA